MLAFAALASFVAGCSDDEGSGGSSQTSASSTSAGGTSSSSGSSKSTAASGSTSAGQDDWRCGVLNGNPNVCDCLPGIDIANATPVASCPPSCCGLYEPGTEDEGCRCHADPQADGFASCDDFLQNVFPTPLTSVASCPPP